LSKKSIVNREPFRFKQFQVHHHLCAHKVGTDGVLLGAWAKHPNPQRILDVGSGSGLIGLMLAQRYPQAQITALDIDEASVEEAKLNWKQSPFSDRAKVENGDFLEWESDIRYDLIVSNLPFYKANYKSPQSSRDRARRALALPHQQLLRKSMNFLNEAGVMALILPVSEAEELIAYSKELELQLREVCAVRSTENEAPLRYLLHWQKTPNPSFTRSSLTLYQNKSRARHPDYERLTQSFYL
jgi:tRNA1Val (adenine37-N6)-methyltransferase